MEGKRSRAIAINLREGAILAVGAALLAGIFLADSARAPIASSETRFVEHSASGLQIVPASAASCVPIQGPGGGWENFCTPAYNHGGDGNPRGGGGGGNPPPPPPPPPPPSPPGNPAPGGWFDGASCDYAYGWACDASDYNQSIEVHIQEGAGVGNPNARLWGVFMANYPVAGNPAACGGTPNHQFRWAIPNALKDGQSHTLYAYALDYPAGGGSFYALSGNPKTINCSLCTPRYYCSGNDLYYGDTTYSYCSNSVVEQCAWGCNGSACLAPPPPDGTLKATPSLVHQGETSEISWTSQYATSCTVVENNPEINDSWSGLNGTKTTSELAQQTKYTLTCQGHPGSTPASFTKSVTVNIVPIFEEN